MNSKQYLNYLILSAEAHERGDVSFGVRTSELELLKTLIENENKEKTNDN